MLYLFIYDKKGWDVLMKAATGELNITVITLIAIAAVISFFLIVLWPQIQGSINTQWNTISSQNGQSSFIVR